ncbi:hypothetical protein LNP04_16935 [Chryseobacterium sp. C-71]|uniref:hypothetical protein n=1 Tax=Chryseobacterium sp. C-71 TaxID=2893882 RepID=UPI001E64D6CC|nr:hypothetical protein [Chryseobacterium sp. C-71]UFH31633.1 hypothetical protein LNP04_16935 [Chryseobacterium sp. C-71]
MSHCNNIRHFSYTVYNHLSRVFKYRLSFSEIGLTDLLILSLVEYSNASGDNSIEIYKLPWTVESVYGNDIDLFIQNDAGTYNWYALQAKVMAFNGAFKDLKFNRKEAFQQWDKLLLHEKKFGSKTFYLLYCGESLRPLSANPTRLDCIGIPSINELGLGIVETNIISDIRSNTLTKSQQFYFEYVFPNHIDSIRKLFCCQSEFSPGIQSFKKEDIETYGYRRIFYDDAKTKGEDEYYDINEIPDGSAQFRIILKNK